MLTKYAYFRGTVKAGQEEAMRAYVEETLKPLWMAFKPSEQVRILYGVKAQSDDPAIPLVLAVTYRDQASLDAAMESEARYKARDLLPQFYDRFFNEVTLQHYLFEESDR